MLSIGNKKYRNLQEQVGYNTECIQELAKAIDGITLEDKLVIIANDSGTFTDEEMTVLNGPLAFISDGSKVWLKQSETPTEFVFKAIDIVATEQGGTHYNVGGSKIVVTRATRAYVTSDDVIITTYSKNQIDTLLSAKASLSGANFIGAITSPSIIETMSGYSFTKATPTNVTLSYIYVGAVKTGNKLTLVCSVEITRTGDVTGGSFTVGSFSIPAEVGQKLYPTTSNWLKIDKIYAGKNYYEGIDLPLLMIKNSDTGISAVAYNVNSLMVLNQKYYLRYEATFLLSDNLAE